MSTFDHIIIGGGSAGCVLASRLSQPTENRILLLEAGGRDRSVLFHIPAGFARMTKGMASWGWSTVPQKFMNSRRVWFTQAKVIGGGSTINAQIYVRGNAQDYDAWANEFGCKGWSYREVLPYFRRAESNERFNDNYHGIDGPLGVSMPKATLPVCDAFIRAAQDYGIPYNPDFNSGIQRGVGFYQLTQREARRCSTAAAYLEPAEARPNLTVVPNAEVLRINIENGRATGVDYRSKGRLASAAADREVVLSAGTIGSPRLLMLSG
ncbi:MAG: FAD-dependent oxidoreductase, partial [Albidovulum sp.]|nr:FAD-dependent oxidoreductase [Albidovulum sp.]